MALIEVLHFNRDGGFHPSAGCFEVFATAEIYQDHRQIGITRGQRRAIASKLLRFSL